ncbi:putative regulator of nonsense transcripts, putative [Trichomonas vaginalis G3]|uniref:Possible regulator of nonsense transcripts, putative n=1 Tax=Trichomonas vaginalis (strain ATCC PRA-98 / G3) TaxID=412133 RepID=A2F4N7_TRIV3|nr:nuclear-transcribed mRNA catabolic process, nonsense-mediated decay [Trichomonas vaginalis G3]EAY00142.1 putative regulator of nonsense transcripts, putative [Trichomonas vaginalis G3]KAI5522743.1 nuclear-transcribed mRNA catabolic process, nonsense-mediated decay [Trichomonas vaginalis G3]|eukprot:XP_001313071.1 possible regulator of nonsense transcripts [Trichomonas vaginalis G3]
MAEPECVFCGCKEITSLAKPKDYNFWLCNAKKGLTASHLVQFLKKSDCKEIELHPGNPFHGIEFKCAVCGQTNIFDLGILITQTNQIIVCSSQCQHDAQFKGKTIQFIPIISNSCVEEQILPFPENCPNEVTPASVSDKIRQLTGVGVVDANKQKLPEGKYQYESVEEYTTTFNAFIQAEMKADYFRAHNTSTSISNIKWENKRKFSFPAKRSMKRKFTPTMSYFISKNNKNKDETEVAFFNKFNDKEGTCSLCLKGDSKFYGANSLKVQRVQNSITFQRQLKSLDYMKNGLEEFWVNLFLGKFDKKQFQAKNGIKKIPLSKDIKVTKQSSGLNFIVRDKNTVIELNRSQGKAVEAALSQRFTYIQGPPGTGKTTSITAIVKSFVDGGIFPVLIVGHSNVTADFGCLALSNIGLKVGRVLSLEIEDAIQAAKLNEIDSEYNFIIPGYERSKFSTFQKAKKQYIEKYGTEPDLASSKSYRKFKKIEQRIIADCQVICVTSSTSGSVRVEGNFRAIIFDEAGQCLDPDFLISMKHNPERLVLVGDTFQLGPTIQNNAVRNAGFGVNLMKKLVKLGLIPNILTYQYRMHPSILEFPSKTFYKNLVKSGISAEQRIYKFSKPNFKFPNPQIPLMFWDVEGKEQSDGDGKSYWCLSQCNAVSQVLDALFNSGVPANSIGIITPYNGQNDYLMDNLDYICESCSAEYIKNVEIATVDGFQGREKDFIIFNLVRSNENYQIGFLSDIERLNVSITRAKYGLIVIGHSRTFSKTKLFCDWFNFFIENNCFMAGGDFKSLQKGTFVPNLDKDPKEAPEEGIFV